jgi:hypothetical protein
VDNPGPLCDTIRFRVAPHPLSQQHPAHLHSVVAATVARRASRQGQPKKAACVQSNKRRATERYRACFLANFANEGPGASKARFSAASRSVAPPAVEALLIAVQRRRHLNAPVGVNAGEPLLIAHAIVTFRTMIKDASARKFGICRIFHVNIIHVLRQWARYRRKSGGSIILDYYYL